MAMAKALMIVSSLALAGCVGPEYGGGYAGYGYGPDYGGFDGGYGVIGGGWGGWSHGWDHSGWGYHEHGFGGHAGDFGHGFGGAHGFAGARSLGGHVASPDMAASAGMAEGVAGTGDGDKHHLTQRIAHCANLGETRDNDRFRPVSLSTPARTGCPCRNVASRNGRQKKAMVRTSMLSRRGAFGGVVGSSNAEWPTKRERPSVSESYVFSSSA